MNSKLIFFEIAMVMLVPSSFAGGVNPVTVYSCGSKGVSANFTRNEEIFEESPLLFSPDSSQALIRCNDSFGHAQPVITLFDALTGIPKADQDFATKIKSSFRISRDWTRFIERKTDFVKHVRSYNLRDTSSGTIVYQSKDFPFESYSDLPLPTLNSNGSLIAFIDGTLKSQTPIQEAISIQIIDTKSGKELQSEILPNQGLLTARPNIKFFPDDLSLLATVEVGTEYPNGYPRDVGVWRFLMDSSTLAKVRDVPTPTSYSTGHTYGFEYQLLSFLLPKLTKFETMGNINRNACLKLDPSDNQSFCLFDANVTAEAAYPGGVGYLTDLRYSLSPDSKYLIAWHFGGLVRVFEVSSYKTIFLGKVQDENCPSNINCSAQGRKIYQPNFSPDGRKVAFYSIGESLSGEVFQVQLDQSSYTEGTYFRISLPGHQ